MAPPFWLAMGGLALAWYIYMMKPVIAGYLMVRFGVLYRILDGKYGFDQLNMALFAGGSRGLGKLFWKTGDQKIIDGTLINGSAHGVGWIAERLRCIQTGYLYHYAIAMILGLVVLLTVFVTF
jgi:NADH-quinone oxidoreductase subunit L